jgi:hypothetical protein
MAGVNTGVPFELVLDIMAKLCVSFHEFCPFHLNYYKHTSSMLRWARLGTKKRAGVRITTTRRGPWLSWVK